MEEALIFLLVENFQVSGLNILCYSIKLYLRMLFFNIKVMEILKFVHGLSWFNITHSIQSKKKQEITVMDWKVLHDSSNQTQKQNLIDRTDF